MDTVTMFWILFAATVITVAGIGWTLEWEKRLDLEQRHATLRKTNADDLAYLAQVEEACLLWEARARRLSAEHPERMRHAVKVELAADASAFTRAVSKAARERSSGGAS